VFARWQCSAGLFMAYLLCFVALTRPFTFIGTSAIFVTVSLLPLVALYGIRQSRARAGDQVS
jgi:hypothetical protein